MSHRYTKAESAKVEALKSAVPTVTDLASASAGHVLIAQADGSGGKERSVQDAPSGSSTLTALTDVTLSGSSHNQVLKYNDGTPRVEIASSGPTPVSFYLAYNLGAASAETYFVNLVEDSGLADGTVNAGYVEGTKTLTLAAKWSSGISAGDVSSGIGASSDAGISAFNVSADDYAAEFTSIPSVMGTFQGLAAPAWINGQDSQGDSGPSTLDELSNVSAGSASDGQLLQFNAGTWSAADAPSGGASKASELSDVESYADFDASSQGKILQVESDGSGGYELKLQHPVHVPFYSFSNINSADVSVDASATGADFGNAIQLLDAVSGHVDVIFVNVAAGDVHLKMPDLTSDQQGRCYNLKVIGGGSNKMFIHGKSSGDEIEMVAQDGSGGAPYDATSGDNIKLIGVFDGGQSKWYLI